MPDEILEFTADGSIRIRRARPQDLSALLDVQHRAFTRVAGELGVDPESMPPASEPLDALESLYADGAVFLVALDGSSRIVGTVRGTISASDPSTVDIGRLAVDDGMEGKGIGRALMRAIEIAFPEALRFDLFTGAQAVWPIRLYESLGYRIYHREMFEDRFELVRLEKRRSTS